RCQRHQTLRARECAGVPASAFRLVCGPAAAVDHEQDRSDRAQAGGGGAGRRRWGRKASGALSESGPTAEVDRRLPIGGEIFLDPVAHFVGHPEAARRALAGAGFAPTPISIQVNPDPAGGPPLPTGTGNVTCMLDRGYLEVLFRTADTSLGREFDAAMTSYRGVHLAAF